MDSNGPGEPSKPPAASPDEWGERLPRRLGRWSAAAVVIGITIGSGIFRTPAEIAGLLPSAPLFLLAWVAGSVVALAGALSLAEVAVSLPRTGGIYVYLREAYGRRTAFLFGWTQLLVLRPAAYGAIALTSAEYTWRLIPFSGSESELYLFVRCTAAFYIAVVAVVNARGVQAGALLQNASTLLKLGALLVLVGLGAFASGRIDLAQSSTVGTAELSSWQAFGLAMVPVLWSYDGWSDVGFVSGEVREPRRILPFGFIVGTAVVVVVYLLVNVAYLSVIPIGQMSASKLVAADVAEYVWGKSGVVFVSAAIAVSTFGALNGSMMTGPRVFYAMAEDGLFFRRLSSVDATTQAPKAAILFSAVLGVVILAFQNFEELTDKFVISIWPFYALAVAAVFVFRARARGPAKGSYRVPGYPWIPGIFLAAAVGLLANKITTQWSDVFLTAAVVLVGLPVYQILFARPARPR